MFERIRSSYNLRTPLIALLALCVPTIGAKATSRLAGGGVLDPTQHARTAAALGPLPVSLTASWRIESFTIEHATLRIVLRSASKRLEARVVEHSEPDNTALVTTPLNSGTLLTPPALPADARDALLPLLNSPQAALTWTPRGSVKTRAQRRPQTRGPPAQYDVLLKQIEALDGAYRGSESPPPVLARGLGPLMERYLHGDLKGLRAELRRCLEEPGDCPSGAVSLYLASGGQLDEELAAVMAQHPAEPRLFALAAKRARLQDRPTEAGMWIQAGMSTSPLDAMLLDEASRLGWRTPQQLSSSHLKAAVTEEESTPWLTEWLALLAAVMLIALCILALRERDWRLGSALIVGLLAARFAVPTLPEAVERPAELPGALRAPLIEAGCKTGPALVGPDHVALMGHCDGTEVEFRVRLGHAKDKGFSTTAHHQLDVIQAGPMAESARTAATVLTARISDAEGAGWRFQRAEAPPRLRSTSSGWPLWQDHSDGARRELRLTAALSWAAAWAAVLWLLTWLFHQAKHLRAAPRWLFVAVGIGVLAHLLVPGRMAMVYGGYDLVGQLIHGHVPRYGAGSLWLYGPFLWMIEADHAVLLVMNRFVGLGCLIAGFTLGAPLWRQDNLARNVGLIALFCLPVIIRSHSIESIVAFPALFVLIGLSELAVRGTRLGLPTLLLGSAALSRPELVLVALMVPIWFASQRPRDVRLTSAFVASAAGIGMLTLAVARLWGQTDQLIEGGALPQTDTALWGVFSAIDYPGIISNPNHTPLGLWLMLLVGVWRCPEPRRAVATLGIALAWLASTGVDLAAISVPRLHTPALVLIIPIAAVGAVAIAQWLTSLGKGGRGFAVITLAILSLQVVWTAYFNFRPVNEDHEEQLWRDALDALPTGPGCLATVWYGDPGSGPKTPRHLPGYLLANERPGWELIKLSDLERRAEMGCQGPTFALLGMRCHADLRADWTEPAPSTASVTICQAVREQFVLSPVIEREVDNYGDLAYPMYPDTKQLTLGLYRLKGPGDLAE